MKVKLLWLSLVLASAVGVAAQQEREAVVESNSVDAVEPAAKEHGVVRYEVTSSKYAGKLPRREYNVALIGASGADMGTVKITDSPGVRTTVLTLATGGRFSTTMNRETGTLTMRVGKEIGTATADLKTKKWVEDATFTKLKARYSNLAILAATVELEVVDKPEVESKLKSLPGGTPQCQRKEPTEETAVLTSVAATPGAATAESVGCFGQFCRGTWTGSKNMCCYQAMIVAGSCCSNQYCWGCCQFQDCDSFCAIGDFFCMCSRYGVACSGF